jgi:hypothetical protein
MTLILNSDLEKQYTSSSQFSDYNTQVLFYPAYNVFFSVAMNLIFDLEKNRPHTSSHHGDQKYQVA